LIYNKFIVYVTLFDLQTHFRKVTLCTTSCKKI